MLKRNLFMLFSITLFALASVVLCISNYNPYTINKYEFMQFYISLFAALAGLVAMVIYFLKYKFYRDKTINYFFLPSLRQGVLVSLSLTALIFLRTMKLLDPWTGISLVIIILLLELFFQTKSRTLKEVK